MNLDGFKLGLRKYVSIADGRRYAWLKKTAPETLAAIAWRCEAAREFSDCDKAIDAAIAHDSEIAPNCTKPL